MMIINEKVENLSREIKVIKKNLKEILKIKNIKLKKLLDWVEKRDNVLEERSI